MIAGAAITSTIIGAQSHSQSTSSRDGLMPPENEAGPRNFFSSAELLRHDHQSSKDQSAGDDHNQLHLLFRNQPLG